MILLGLNGIKKIDTCHIVVNASISTYSNYTFWYDVILNYKQIPYLLKIKIKILFYWFVNTTKVLFDKSYFELIV